MPCVMRKRSPRRRVAWLLLAWVLAGWVQPAWAQTAQEIIRQADAIRNPDRSFRLTSTLSDYVGGKLRDQNVLAVYASPGGASGQFRNLVRYTAPPRDAGKAALLDGTALWFYDPASKVSVRISPQQRLIGQAAIGDVLTMNLAADYSGRILGTETIQDAGRVERDCWHLDMQSSSDRATYYRVEYWVERATFRPIKAKFYTDSGRLLKILYYRGFANLLGADRPTEAVIIDAVDSNLVTSVTFSDWRFQDVPDAWFQHDFLPRLPP
jgi:outer membrane lipoprotein-sorting protein